MGSRMGRRVVQFANLTLKLLMPKTFTNIKEIALKTIPSASKIEIRRVLESLYGFEVEKVQTLNMEGKKKKRGGLLIAKPDYKKAYVTLKNPEEDPEEDPVEDPEEALVEDPEEALVEDPVEDPEEALVEDPVEDPEEARVEAPVEAPLEDPEEDLVEDPEEDTVEDPEEAPEEDTEEIRSRRRLRMCGQIGCK
ncbi:hypothetical protein LR48_Vigan07g054000 [Vigna angularis]|uniref:Large ribosomal subunit protein uL23m n=1 Tax=Phaseolus angularis TaxID=3914 RepID=A0A0L9UVS1_PHAAN|nr:hypothetical protein LR48_Vigan07g054000 [Vigna angularis]